MLASILIPAILGLIGIIATTTSQGIANHRQVEPEYQQAAGEAAAANTNAQLAGTKETTADFNNYQWTSSFLNQVDTYKKAGLNPQLLAQGGSTMNLTSASGTPSNSVTTQPLDFSQLLNVANSIPNPMEIEKAKLQNEMLKENINAKRNQELREAAKFGDELALKHYNAENAKQVYKERVDTYQARYDYLMNNLTDQEDKHKLAEVNLDIQKLLKEEKAARQQYFDELAKLEVETDRAKKDEIQQHADELDKQNQLLQKKIDRYDEMYDKWKEQVDHKLEETSPNAQINKLVKSFGFKNESANAILTLGMMFLFNRFGGSYGSDSKGNTNWNIGF